MRDVERLESTSVAAGTSLKGAQLARRLDSRRLPALALGLAAAASVALTGPTLAQETIRVGAAPFAGPVTFMNPETETFGGYMVDLMVEIAAANGFEVEFIPLLVQDLGPALATGDIDIVAGIIVDIPPIREAFLLSQPIYPFTEGLFVAADDPGTYTSLADLEDKRVAIQIGTYDDTVEGADVGIEVVRVESILDALAAVDSGEADAAIVGGPTGAYQLFLGNYPNTRRAEAYQPFATVQGVMAVRMEDVDLMHSINEAIDQLTDDGTLTTIFAQYGATYVPMD